MKFPRWVLFILTLEWVHFCQQLTSTIFSLGKRSTIYHSRWAWFWASLILAAWHAGGYFCFQCCIAHWWQIREYKKLSLKVKKVWNIRNDLPVTGLVMRYIVKGNRVTRETSPTLLQLLTTAAGSLGSPAHVEVVRPAPPQLRRGLARHCTSGRSAKWTSHMDWVNIYFDFSFVLWFSKTYFLLHCTIFCSFRFW